MKLLPFTLCGPLTDVLSTWSFFESLIVKISTMIKMDLDPNQLCALSFIIIIIMILLLFSEL